MPSFFPVPMNICSAFNIPIMLRTFFIPFDRRFLGGRFESGLHIVVLFSIPSDLNGCPAYLIFRRTSSFP